MPSGFIGSGLPKRNAGHAAGHFGLLANGRFQCQMQAGMTFAQLSDEGGQVFAGMSAYAQKHGHDTNGVVALLNQCLHRIVQAGCHQFQKGAANGGLWGLAQNFVGHGIDRGAPLGVA